MFASKISCLPHNSVFSWCILLVVYISFYSVEFLGHFESSNFENYKNFALYLNDILPL
jgi:hypothetical protein